MKVLLAVVCDPSNLLCSLGFAVSMLRLQTAMVGAPTALQAVLEIVPSVRQAIDLVASDSSFDAVVAIRAQLAFPAGFVLRALASGKPFVAGVYPLAQIDWERVKSKAGSAESPEFRGNVYNLDASKAKFVGSGYLQVDDIEPGAVVLTRAAIDAIAAAKPRVDTDIPSMWGKPILADMDNQCSNFGPVEFVGCVGMRSALR